MQRTGYETCNNQELFDCEELYREGLGEIPSNDPEVQEYKEELYFIHLEVEQRNQDNATAIMNY